MTKELFKKLQVMTEKHQELSDALSQPGIAPQKMKALSIEHSQLIKLKENLERFEQKVDEAHQLKALIDSETDEEMRTEAKQEQKKALEEIKTLEENLLHKIIPPDPMDFRNVIIEIRAGVGGDEAALFAQEIFRMYQLYSEKQGWKFEVLSISENDLGGYKEASAQISGEGVYSVLKYEVGVHRVQRVPQTETSGRVHTSTMTVAVLPEVDEVDVTINDKDLRIDTYRARGAGGQHVNKTESAVRITHIPSGIVVAIQDDRSQIRNRQKAMKILRSRLYEQQKEKAMMERNEKRTEQIGTGERSERIRTYHFVQGRVTDHRCGMTVHSVQEMMDGDALDQFYQSMKAKEIETILKQISKS